MKCTHATIKQASISKAAFGELYTDLKIARLGGFPIALTVEGGFAYGRAWPLQEDKRNPERVCGYMYRDGEGNELKVYHPWFFR